MDGVVLFLVRWAEKGEWAKGDVGLWWYKVLDWFVVGLINKGSVCFGISKQQGPNL